MRVRSHSISVELVCSGVSTCQLRSRSRMRKGAMDVLCYWYVRFLALANNGSRNVALARSLGMQRDLRHESRLRVCCFKYGRTAGSEDWCSFSLQTIPALWTK